MNKHFWTGLFVLGLLAAASPAYAFSFNCGSSEGGATQMQAGPWYLYFPYEAHFNLPAPVGYPFWPAPVTAAMPPGSYGAGGPPGPLQVPEARPLTPAPVPAPAPAPGPATVGYYYYGGVPTYPAPSYWYGR